MDRWLQRLADVATIGTLFVTLATTSWLSKIFGLPAPSFEFGGFQLPSLDLSGLPFGLRISAAMLLNFAYSWLWSFMVVFLLATKTPAGISLGAILTFLAAVIVLSTTMAVGFNLPLGQLGSSIAGEIAGWVVFSCFATWLLFVFCAATHWLRQPELRGLELGFPAVLASGLVFGVAQASFAVT